MGNIMLDCLDSRDKLFEEYGQVISPEKADPAADCDELMFWNRLGVMSHTGNTSVNIVRTYGRNGLIERDLERHLNTGEALLASKDIYIVVALSKGDEPDLDTVKAFSVKAGEGVILSPGTWHHAPLTKADTADTFVVFCATTPEEDMYAVNLEEKYGITYEVKI